MKIKEDKKSNKKRSENERTSWRRELRLRKKAEEKKASVDSQLPLNRC